MTPGRFLRDLVIVLSLAGVLVWCSTRWLVAPVTVYGSSMEPTLRSGERVLVDLWGFRNRLPRDGDVVVMAGPSGEALVKRVAREPYPGKNTYPQGTMTLDSPLEPSFLVLGDNLAVSGDSRGFGRVPLHRIRGRVFFRYWPPARAGSIE